jgi:hypothetical protein
MTSDVHLGNDRDPLHVMAGLVPAIHDLILTAEGKSRMPTT